MSRTGLLVVLEVVAVAAIAAWVGWIGVPASIQAALLRAEAVAPTSPTGTENEATSVDESERVEPPRDPAGVRQRARASVWLWLGGIAALLGGRLAALSGPGRAIAAPLLVPSVAMVTGLGLTLHWAYADPLRSEVLGGAAFAQGVFLGGLIAAAVMTVPFAPDRVVARAALPLALVAVGALVALYFFGETPGRSGARVRLFGAQPIEGVKLAFVALVAILFGRRAEQLRYQRTRRGIFEIPRPKLLAPAVALVVVLFLGLYLVRDFGPTLILALVFLALYYAATRSWTELVVLALLSAAAFWVVSSFDPLLPTNVATRLAMMNDPWLNGRPGGDQLAASLWAFAAGGIGGRGLGQAALGVLPAGHTDLMLAHLAEVMGLAGLGLYLLALLAFVLSGYWIALRNRTPERMLLACGLATLVFAQLIVIFGGSTGLLPLTGVVVPFLSFGRTSMVIFLLITALLVRLAAGGQPVREHDAIRQLRGGIARLAAGVIGLAAVLLVVAAERTVLGRAENMTNGVLAIGYDDAVFLRYDPRLQAIARRIKRGEIHDRQGATLAGTDPLGKRTYPLGSALGTLTGILEPSVGTPPWALEGILDARLRGLRDVHEPLSVWIERHPDEISDDGTVRVRRDRILFTTPTDAFLDADHARAKRLQAPGTTLLFSRLRRLDLRPLVPLATKRGAEREAAIRRVSADVAARTVRLTLDARLQAAAARAIADLADGALAGAAAVIAVDTGQVLARAQWPDIDPADRGRWLALLRDVDPVFTGSYGPWKDKTGVAGLYQAGSIFKLFTALAWAGEGSTADDLFSGPANSCEISGRTTFDCRNRDGKGPFFTRPDWQEPIHDAHAEPDGVVDITQALAVSCNVFFSQLGLDLGPAPLQRLASEGLEIDNRRRFEPGRPGSRRLAATAFGQGAARMHVLEAARMAAAIGGGGTYRRCPPSMRLDAVCEERSLLDDPARVRPILAGMRRAATDGTARRLRAPEGVRLYAKTGTATDPGRIDETPYGFTRGATYPEHSWLVALAEPIGASPCDPRAPGRLAFAAVVPRGGAGAGPALRIVQRLIDQAASFGLLAEVH